MISDAVCCHRKSSPLLNLRGGQLPDCQGCLYQSEGYYNVPSTAEGNKTRHHGRYTIEIKMEANDYAALRTEAPSVFFGIARMSGTWFDNDDGNLSAGDETIKASRRERLQYIARQMMQSCPEESLQPKLCKMVRWVQMGANSRKSSTESVWRFRFLGLVFGASVM